MILTAIMEMAREGRYRLPASMRSVIMSIDLTIDGPSLPVIAVTALEFKGKPHIYKTSIDQTE